MRRLAVIAYPNIDAGEREWLETFRAQHDPQAARLGVHFTLVFPCDEPCTASGQLADEVGRVTESISTIPFAIAEALAVPDPQGAGGHVFLLPDRGRAEISQLHNRLYEGPFREVPFRGVPFVPHLTVAARSSSAACELLAQQLSERATRLRGSLDRLELVDVSEPVVHSLRSFPLGS